MKPVSSRFSPRLLDLETLEALTVGREAVCAHLVDSIWDAVSSGQGRFDVVVGPRGIGKSHTFGLVEGRLRERDKAQQQVVIVALPEEFHPSSLVHLLAKVLELMPDEDGLPRVASQLANLRMGPQGEALKTAQRLIAGRLGARGLLLMVENFDAILRDLGTKGQASLRRLVQRMGCWSIFATARSTKGWTEQTAPLHGTFNVEQLAPLDASSATELIRQLARLHGQTDLHEWLGSDEGRLHVHSTYALLGGNPRVMAMVFHHLDHDDPGDLYGNFFRLAEELTPYYQEQMERLSRGQRPVVEFLAERWSPASVTEISNGTFCPQASVSTHLRALKRDRLVHALKVGKNRYYELSDPLHRIARAMKRDQQLGNAISNMARVWGVMARNDFGYASLSSLHAFHAPPPEYVKNLASEILRHSVKGDANKVDTLTDRLIAHGQSDDSSLYAICGTLLLTKNDKKAYHFIDMQSRRDFGAYAITSLYLALTLTPELRRELPLSWPKLAQSTDISLFYATDEFLEITRDGIRSIEQKGGPKNLATLLIISVLRDFGENAAAQLYQSFEHDLTLQNQKLLGVAAWIHNSRLFYEGLVAQPLAGTDEGRSISTLFAIDSSSDGHSTLSPKQEEWSLENADWLATLWIAGRPLLPTSHTFSLSTGSEERFELLSGQSSVKAFMYLPREMRRFIRVSLTFLHASNLLEAFPAEDQLVEH